MKKVLITVVEIITFVVIYEIFAFIVNILFGLMYSLFTKFPTLYAIINVRIWDGIIYSLIPIFMAISIIILMGFLFKKVRITIISFILIEIFLIYICVSDIINTIFANGLLSWNTANVIWSDLLIIFIISFGIIELSDVKFIKRSEVIDQ